MAKYQPVGERHNIQLNQNGLILCNKCSHVRWCTHIEDSVRHHKDSIFIWQTNHPEGLSEEWQLEIPIFPTEDLWEWVYLTKTDGPFIRYKIEWPVVHTPGNVMPTEMVGFISPGEGRGTIRALLVEQLWSHFDPKKECESGLHNPKSEFIWQGHMLDSGLKVVELWSVWRNQMCLTCLKGVDDMDDLVPEEQRTGVWNK